MIKPYCLLIPGVVFILSVLTTSCNQNLPVRANIAALNAIAQDETQSALISDDIINEVDTYVNDSVLSGIRDSVRQSGPAITINKTDTLYPKTFILDYGTTGITLNNGNIVTGKIIAVLDSKMKLKNSKRSITLIGFTENGKTIKGKKIITFRGLNSANLPYWNVSTIDTITQIDGSKILWYSARTRVRINNNATPHAYWDDIYGITGTSNGINANGKTFSTEIRNNYPLMIGSNWPMYIMGKISISSENEYIALDYGSGTKDSVATTIVNGETNTYTFQH